MNWPVNDVRSHFTGLNRRVNGQTAAFFDGPAGSQVPEKVVLSVADYLRHTNCNRGGLFTVGRESDALLDAAHRTVADFLGTRDPDCVIFGANMTTLTMQVSRAISREWNAGDEIIVTHLDHDANVSPWVLAARDRGVHVHHVGLQLKDCTLNMDDLFSRLSPRTRLVAAGYASNATGTINPVREIIRAAHDVGALVYVDAVHYAPHGRICVDDLDCDFLVCSAYKFCGPHVGVLYGRRSLLTDLQPYKLRPCTEQLPGRWMTGTQNHEGIVGTAAAVDYLAGLAGGPEDVFSDRGKQLDKAFQQIVEYEKQLGLQLLDGLKQIPEITIYGISETSRAGERVPTFSFTWRGRRPAEIAEALGARGLFVWHGNHYALPFTEAAGLEPEGTVRVGLLHYNTSQEVDRLLSALQEMSG